MIPLTYEQAYYHKLMLEIGLTDEFDMALDKMLEEEEPLHPLTLELSTCGGDRNSQIHILNEYVLNVEPERIDREKVFDLVIGRFRKLHEKDPGAVEQITKLMYSITSLTGWWSEDPWYTMNYMNDYYDCVKEGISTERDFTDAFLRLLYQKEAVNPFAKKRARKSIFEKLKRLFR